MPLDLLLLFHVIQSFIVVVILNTLNRIPARGPASSNVYFRHDSTIVMTYYTIVSQKCSSACYHCI